MRDSGWLIRSTLNKPIQLDMSLNLERRSNGLHTIYQGLVVSTRIDSQVQLRYGRGYRDILTSKTH